MAANREIVQGPVVARQRASWGNERKLRRTAVGVRSPSTAAGNRCLQRLPEQTLRGSRHGGNRALALRAQRRVLARYDTGEHALFGSDRIVLVKDDVQITEGEMITMGDLSDRPEDMYQADTSELRTLVKLVRRDREAYVGQGNAPHVSDDEWEKATLHRAHPKKTYLELPEHKRSSTAPSPRWSTTGSIRPGSRSRTSVATVRGRCAAMTTCYPTIPGSLAPAVPGEQAFVFTMRSGRSPRK